MLADDRLGAETQAHMQGYTGWYESGSVVIRDDQFSSVDDLFYNIVHESRHARGESHGSSGFFDDEYDFADGCWQTFAPSPLPISFEVARWPNSRVALQSIPTF
jgi:hypothetical protein